MLHADPGQSWVSWIVDHADADDDTKLAALREYIERAFRDSIGAVNGLTAEWANKKMGPLGITAQIAATHAYTLEVPASGLASVLRISLLIQ